MIFVSISGFGPTGPYAGKGAYDTVIQAYGGLAMNQSDPDTGEPVFLRQVIADKVTALTAVQAITAALYARDHGAGGQHVELSMLDAVVSFLWADSAGNEVLVDADGSKASSFVAAFKPLVLHRRLGSGQSHVRRRLRRDVSRLWSRGRR